MTGLKKIPIDCIGKMPGSLNNSKPVFTIFIPTYNRIQTLPTTFESLLAQTFTDFEVIVIDDGSNDGTSAIIPSWQSRAFFPIKYVYQQNQGKAAAHNRALKEAEGELFMTLDSNDSMLPTALEDVFKHWNQIPDEEREQFAGISGLCLDENSDLSGTPYPEDVMDSDYLKMSALDSIRGEKREALRTDILRAYPYPIIEGEKHIRPNLIFLRLSLQYKIRFVNIPFQINRHAPDGITAHRFEYRMKNPKGLRLCFLESITLFSDHYGFRKLLRNSIRYVRYSLHSGVGFIEQSREIKHVFLWFVALPIGTFKWARDTFRRKLKGI